MIPVEPDRDPIRWLHTRWYRVRMGWHRMFEHWYWYRNEERYGFVWTILGRTFNVYLACGRGEASRFHLAVGFRWREWPPR